MNENKPCKKDLLEWINIVSFAVDDVKYYGPLTLDTATTQMDYWKWINEPWPWQEGGC